LVQGWSVNITIAKITTIAATVSHPQNLTRRGSRP
jgi:hypothetical protein